MMDATVQKREVTIGQQRHPGTLRMPAHPRALVIFAHGAGSSRFSPRNAFVAERLAERGLASVLFDLLTEDEAAERANVFDIPLLATRLIEAIRWAASEPGLGDLPVGLFGASTGAAAALMAAAQVPVAAIVSRGGRPDLAGPALRVVTAPTLLIVGGADHGVIGLNREAAHAMRCEHRLAIVPGATHLFEQPGALEQVVALGADWFDTHFGRATER